MNVGKTLLHFNFSMPNYEISASNISTYVVPTWVHPYGEIKPRDNTAIFMTKRYCSLHLFSTP
jgi:hypothetical protein